MLSWLHFGTLLAVIATASSNEPLPAVSSATSIEPSLPAQAVSVAENTADVSDGVANAPAASTTPTVVPKPRAPGMWDEPAPVPAPKRSYKIGICFSIPPRQVSMYTNGA